MTGPKRASSFASRVWEGWASPPAEACSRGLIIAGAAFLVLDSAGTIRLGFTVTVSYVLLAGACVVGFPSIVKGYARLPKALRWGAAGLFLTYAASLALNQEAALGEFVRAGPERGFVYLGDLALGLGILGLVVGLWATRSPRPLMLAAVLGAGIAGIYGVYQWLALEFALPFSDVNNTLDSNGVTAGGPQGAGLFGARVRGTFLEPHFLAGYLASMIPLAGVAVATLRGRWRALAMVGLLAMLSALTLTSSAPGWAVLVCTIPLAATFLAIGRGRVVPAASAAAVAVAIFFAAPAVLASPAVLEPLVGRSSTDLAVSTAFRTQTWRFALDLWAERPALGGGPGQSSVRLTAPNIESLFGQDPGSLRSAQGIWAAALLDGGLISLALWALVLGSILYVTARTLTRAPTLMRAGALAAATAVVIEALISGDRLFPREWLLLAFALATACSKSAQESGAHDESLAPEATSPRRRPTPSVAP